ncbi:hypothetical protein D3C73_1042990 [compost metagenome]
MRAVGHGLVVGVVLVQVDRRKRGIGGDLPDGGQGNQVTGGIPCHGIAWVGDLRAGILRVRVVHVKARTIAEDHVHQEGAGLVCAIQFQLLATISQGDRFGVEHWRLVRQLAGIRHRPVHGPTAGIVQRFLVRVVPPRLSPAGRPLPGNRGISLNDPGGHHGGVGSRR